MFNVFKDTQVLRLQRDAATGLVTGATLDAEATLLDGVVAAIQRPFVQTACVTGMGGLIGDVVVAGLAHAAADALEDKFGWNLNIARAF